MKPVLGNFYRHLAIFIWSHWLWRHPQNGSFFNLFLNDCFRWKSIRYTYLRDYLLSNGFMDPQKMLGKQVQTNWKIFVLSNEHLGTFAFNASRLHISKSNQYSWRFAYISLHCITLWKEKLLLVFWVALLLLWIK